MDHGWPNAKLPCNIMYNVGANKRKPNYQTTAFNYVRTCSAVYLESSKCSLAYRWLPWIHRAPLDVGNVFQSRI